MNLKRVFIPLIFALTLLSLLSFTSFAAGTEVLNAAQIIKIGSNTLLAKGTLTESVISVGGSVTIAGEVINDVVSVGGSIILKPTARVHGNAVSIGGVVKRESGSKVAGNTTEVNMPQNLGIMVNTGAQMGPQVLFFATALASLLAFLGVLALGVIVSVLFPKRIGWTSVAIEHHPWQTLGWGLAWWALLLPMTLLMIVSVIGIPIVFILWLLYGLAVVLGYISVTQLIGKKLLVSFKRYNQPIATEVLWGVVLMALVNLIPVLGQLITAVICTMGLGAAWMSRLGEMG
ncbi:MAG: hypothetical protein AABZ57_08085 [Candidatus Margulisiibacteriota bacterium]